MVPQLGFGEALSLACSRISDMKGRSRRSEFWWTILAAVIANIIFMFIPVVGPILQLALMVALVPLMLRRMHDAGHGNGLVYTYIILYALYIIFALIAYFSFRSALGATSDAAFGSAAGTGVATGALTLIISLALLVIAIICIVFWCQDSQGPNQYGPSPKYPEGKPQFQQPQQMYQQPQQGGYQQPQQ